MRFSRQVLLGLGLGVATGVFWGEKVAVLKPAADAFVRLLQMTVLPYVTLSIVTNLGTLTYARVRAFGLRLIGVLAIFWATALFFACLLPVTFPEIHSAAFFSPALAERPEPFDFLNLYVTANPFNALANSIVPAVVLFSVLLGLALIGVDNKRPLLDVLQAVVAAVGRMARAIIRLTPYGIFAIAAQAAGTLDLDQLQRIQVYLIAYCAFSLLLSLWVLPGLVSALTPIGAVEMLSASLEGLVTAFVIGDLFVVLPSLMHSSSSLIEKRIDSTGPTKDLPTSIVPMSFTFPHSGKLLSLSFVLFAGWFSDSLVPLVRYPQLVFSGFFSFFGSLNVAVPFLLDLFRIPDDTFQLFLATSVINSRFGTLLAAVHTVAIGVLGSAVVAGAVRFRPARIVRFLVITVLLTAALVAGLRLSFAAMVKTRVDGLAVINSMQPLVYPPIDSRLVIGPSDVPADSIPRADQMLHDIRARGVLRVGVFPASIPYEFPNSANQVVGLDVEMAQNLAVDLGVGIQFVQFPVSELTTQVHNRTIDIVMSGARVTPERTAEFAMSDSYLDETLAVVMPDYARGQFQSWDAIRALRGVRVGVQDQRYYTETVRRLLPDAQLTIVRETADIIDPNAPFDAYILPAERGSILTMLYPRFSVVIPDGATVKMPLGYPIAGQDPAWIRYVNTWVELKKREGFVDRLYDQWILGKASVRAHPRWSVARNVLHWVN